MGKILLVEDSSETRKVLRTQLTEAGHEVLDVETEDAALERIQRTLPDIVLVDINASDVTDFEICQKLRNTPQNNLIYIIIILTDSQEHEDAMGRVADDYVTKPFTLEELLARIRKGLHAVEKKRSSMKDALSELYDRNFFNRYLVQEVERVQRYDRDLALIYIDIDNFKAINDTYGHLIGDVVLAEISKVVRKYCRETDIPVRWGGEECAVLLPETDLEGGVQLAERIREAIDAHQFEDVPHITASFGVADLKTDEQNLLMRTESALHKAKRSGRNNVAFNE